MKMHIEIKNGIKQKKIIFTSNSQEPKDVIKEQDKSWKSIFRNRKYM